MYCTILQKIRNIAGYGKNDMPTINQLVRKGRKRIVKKDQYARPDEQSPKERCLH